MLGAAPVDERAADFAAESAAKLKSLTEICERLWPAVRFFGLCGANPEYIEAMADLGEFLGKGTIGEKSVNVKELVRKTQQEMPGKIAEWLRTSRDARGVAGGKMADRFADAIEKIEIE